MPYHDHIIHPQGLHNQVNDCRCLLVCVVSVAVRLIPKVKVIERSATINRPEPAWARSEQDVGRSRKAGVGRRGIVQRFRQRMRSRGENPRVKKKCVRSVKHPRPRLSCHILPFQPFL